MYDTRTVHVITWVFLEIIIPVSLKDRDDDNKLMDVLHNYQLPNIERNTLIAWKACPIG